MAESTRSSRTITIAGGIVATTTIAVTLTLNWRDVTPEQIAMVAVAGAVMCFVALHALPIRGLRMRRNGLNAEAVFLDLSVAAPLIAFGGAIGVTAVAVVFLLGYSSAAILARSKAVTDLARHGVLRSLSSLLLLPFMGSFYVVRAMPLLTGSITWGAILAFLYAFYVVAISSPVSSYAYHISLSRIWGRIARDPRTWIVGAGNLVWAIVVRDPILSGHYLIAVAMWLPVMLTAQLLRTIDEQHAELHRLRLVRDAVQAMLGDRDPLPQINAILATLRVPSFDETVSVLAATTSRTESWRAVTTLGPKLSSAGDELRRRILARLKFSGEASATLRDDYYVAYAFAARLADGEIHGAMVVHRRNDRPLSADQLAQFTNAAFELAPLLRDMRTIAATQSAATIDGLTGLYNRAMTMERLQLMLDEMTIAEHGAVLLIDIDHFKSVNDFLGHAAGDDCLRKIGEIMRNAVRGGDTAGRIGGEEFLIVMPGATRDVALGVGERLRLAIALGGMRYANGEPVTASLGVAAAAVGDTMEALLARADRGLYEAKRLGRNRIVENTETA